MTSGEQFASNMRWGLNFPRAYLGGLEAVARSYEPVLKGFSRLSLEGLALVSRRSQAWLTLATRLSECRTPADVASAQMQFWQSAAAEYGQVAQRLAAAFGACVALPELKGVAQRDFISVEDPATAAGKRNDRKAA